MSWRTGAGARGGRLLRVAAAVDPAACLVGPKGLLLMAAEAEPGRRRPAAAIAVPDETVRDESWRRTACAPSAVLGQPGVDVHRGRRRVVAGPGGRVRRADRVGAGQRRGGPGQRDRDLAVHRYAHLSESAERRAQRGVAVSFWLLAPYIAAESARDLAVGHRAEVTVIGIALTAVALIAMPLLGRAKHQLGARLGSAATAGEGTQNYLCAAQAAAVLVGLAVTAAWPGGWWLDPVIGLGIAAVAVREGTRSWRGDDCC